MRIAKVEPLTTARALRGPFDYRLPASLDGVGIGSVLVVPFGRQRVLGVIVGLADRSSLPAERLAEPHSALDVTVPPELVELGLWVAREYCSTPARGLELVLAPGTTSRRGRPAARHERFAALTAAGAAALRAGDCGDPPAGGARLGPRQRQALTLLADHGEDGVPAATLSRRGVGGETLRRLERRGLVAIERRRVERRPRATPVGATPPGPLRLSAAQDAALERIRAAMDASPAARGPAGAAPERGAAAEREWLLHGVTGSGKTEVYLGAVEAALARGRGAIVLVPEIGLTPQTVARFAARFGDRVAVLHSRLSAGERRDEWERVRSGAARICVGPRSAVFAPLADLGLLIIDEEHDPSYKQEGDPRYDAREVARRRAAEAGAVLVCGSATPRPESWARMPRLQLPERVDGRGLPPVEVLDMRGRHSHLHPRTREALTALRAEGGKAIVLVNRRGWTPFMSCGACGHAWTCPNCDVSLVLHRQAGELRCHHCGHAEPVPRVCGECGSVSLARSGTGSERAADLIGELVSPLPVFRLDSDSAARAGSHLEILRSFEAAGDGVLVGTQMVAKGHDFPDVVLAVVLDADASLRFPDFRAEERTFSLVAQLAGRSGRGERGGRVLVQTLAPEASAIRAAARHDAAGFLAAELERRRELGYPPFSHLIGIELAAADEPRLEALAAELRAGLDASLPAGASALGPAPRFRLRGRHRRRLLVKAQDRDPAVGAVREVVEAAAAERRLRGIALTVDVDPQ